MDRDSSVWARSEGLPFFALAELGNLPTVSRICEKGRRLLPTRVMEVFGKSVVIAEPRNVIFLSSILNGDGGCIPSHKCERRCQNEHVFGNMYRCKLTGITHICDKNCNQRIVYDNHSSLCRVSGQVFPLSPLEEQAVRGIRRKLDGGENTDGSCAFKRRRESQLHPSPFERSFHAATPICSQIGEGMDMS